jgi:S1-C subfamily serine protease
MRLAAIAFGIAVSLSSPATAAEWWWIGFNGATPNRVVTYVDRETVHDSGRGKMQVWTLAVGESALPNGQQHQGTLYELKCRERSLSMLKRVALDSAGAPMTMAETVPSGFSPVARGSIGESVLNFVCGKPSGMEVRVQDAVQHAFNYLTGGAQRAAMPEQQRLSTGTGFFVSPNGELVTSHHVVEGAKRIAVYLPDGTRQAGVVTRISPATDLAVVKLNRSTPNFLTLGAPNGARAGDRVFTFGFPVTSLLGSEPKFTDGAISSLTGIGDEAAFSQISVPVQPGNSGGPLVNERGEVVGVIAAAAAVRPFIEATGTLPQNVNWAVRAEYVAPLIRGGKRPPVRSREDAVARAREAVALVVVER